MTGNALQKIEQIESSLWEEADQLCTNPKLIASENAMPVFVVPEGNANFGWVRHIVYHGVGSDTSDAWVTRRLGVA